MISHKLLINALLCAAYAQVQLSTDALSTIANFTVSVPTGPYLSYSSQVSLATTYYPSIDATTTQIVNSRTASSNGTTTSNSLLLVGTSVTSSSRNATMTTSTVQPQNTQACNNYPEFCSRKYGNITEVTSHNSAFVRANSAFANQDLSIVAQLNDGIRMIQGETHYVNDTIFSCHTNCTFLNAGTFESELTTVREWLDSNPYDVVTILIVNSDYIAVENYTAPIVNSGLSKYAYEPPKAPMTLDDWPTLSALILSDKRAIIFMDYEANQTSVPYILDEFSQMWETPFSPTDPSFPCTAQRPPGITDEQADDRLYLANHNLNIGLSFGGSELLIPDFSNLTSVNAVNGTASLGLMARECRSMWNRPPNFLLVDFYDYGNGSVFEVAAQMNNVTYNRKCCGTDTALSGAATLTLAKSWLGIMAVIAFSYGLLA